MGQRVTYGRKAVQDLLGARADRVQKLCVAEGARGAGIREIIAAARGAGIPIQHVPRRVLDRKAEGGVHQGVVAETQAIATCAIEEVLATVDMNAAPMLVACSGITDPHNIGAIARSALAAGAVGLVLPTRKSAALTATVQKAAAGALDRLTVARAPNLAQALEACKAQGFWIFGTAADGAADLHATDLTLPLVLVLGSEGTGLSPRMRKVCDAVISIPLAAASESLNVSVAAGVVLFEAVRQRRAAARESGAR